MSGENLMPKVEAPEPTTPGRTKMYHLGVLPDTKCPRSVVHVAGQDFPLYTEQVTKIGGEGVTSRSRLPGVVCHLSDAKVQEILSKVRNKVFRGHRLLDIKMRNYLATPGDKPLAGFLYIKELVGNELIIGMPVPLVDKDAAAAEKTAREGGGQTDANARARAAAMKQVGGTTVNPTGVVTGPQLPPATPQNPK